MSPAVKRWVESASYIAMAFAVAAIASHVTGWDVRSFGWYWGGLIVGARHWSTSAGGRGA